MNTIIKVTKNYNLGEVLALIKKADTSVVKLHILENSNFLRDIDNMKIVRAYASYLGKDIDIIANKNLEKVGFTLGQDITKVESLNSEKPLKKSLKKPKFNMLINVFKFKKLQKGSPSTSIKKMHIHKSVFMYVLSFFLFLFIILGSLGWFLYMNIPKAKVTIKQKSEIFSTVESVLVTLPDLQVDKEPSDLLILQSGNVVKKEISGDMVGPATGEKEIGKYAKGKLKIFNKTDNERPVKKGDKVELTVKDGDTKEKFIFIVQESVDVPKKSTQEIKDDSGETKKADVFGEKTVQIKAENVGMQYNLDKGDVSSILFTDKDNDNFILELDGDINGGTSKKVTVVTSKDLEDLEDKLFKKLKKELFDSLKSDVSEDTELLEGAVSYNINSKQFDKKEGEEGGEIKLTMTVKGLALVFLRKDLKNLLSNKIEALIPESFYLAEDSDTISITNNVKDLVTDSKGTPIKMIINSKIQSFIKPNLEVNAIKKEISGRTIEYADRYIKNLRNVNGVVIEVTPDIPFLYKKLPRKLDNIEVYIESTE